MLKSLFRKLYYRVPLFLQASESQQALRTIKVGLNELHHEIGGLRRIISNNTLEELRRFHSSRQGAKSLHPYEAQVCSQNGEDGVILEIFKRIGVGTRTFVEIGVGDGRENNTAFLLSLGWQGYWIDGSDSFVATLKEKGYDKSEFIRFKVALVDRENIEALFSVLAVPVQVDLLSIDIDQNTYHIWSALERFRPRVVVIEYNSTIPPDIDWKVTYAAERVWDWSNNFGASLKAFELLGRRLGYSLVHCELLGNNAFFIRDDLLGDHFCSPYTAEYHFQPTRFGLSLRHGHRNAILDRVPRA